jgi:hypothetical protein
MAQEQPLRSGDLEIVRAGIGASQTQSNLRQAAFGLNQAIRIGIRKGAFRHQRENTFIADLAGDPIEIAKRSSHRS